MKITFLSQKEAEALDPEPTMAIISIVSTGGKRDLKPGWASRIDLEFNNVTKIVPEEERFSGYKVFDVVMAEKLVQFIKTLPSGVLHIVIHCHDGASRSAAIAKVLCEKYNAPFPIDHPYFNILVYTLFKEVMQKQNLL